jgi:hypothetical protein
LQSYLHIGVVASVLLPAILSYFGLLPTHFHPEDDYVNAMMILPSSLSGHADHHPLIRHQTIQGLPFNGTFAHYTCHEGEYTVKKLDGLRGRRAPYPPSLTPGVLDFSTRIQSSSLRILVIGDSLGQQMVEALEEALDVDPETRVDLHPGEMHGIRTMSFPKNKSNGGGYVAWWQMNSLLSSSNRNTAWRLSDVDILRNATNSKDDDTTVADVVILRIPVGWIQLEDVTQEFIKEAIDIVFNIITGCQVVIVSTIPHCNNFKTHRHVALAVKKNEMVRDIVDNYYQRPPSPEDGLRLRPQPRQVFYLDMARLTDGLIVANAEFMGVPSNETYVGRLKTKRWSPVVSQICGILVPRDSPFCSPNLFSVDGMHWCPNAVAARMNAALACLIGCWYNNKDNHAAATVHVLRSSDDDQQRQCAHECNSRYMNVRQTIQFDHDVVSVG